MLGLPELSFSRCAGRDLNRIPPEHKFESICLSHVARLLRSNETRSAVVDNRVDGYMYETPVGKEFFAEGIHILARQRDSYLHVQVPPFQVFI
jgi:hypothetical protein